MYRRTILPHVIGAAVVSTLFSIIDIILYAKGMTTMFLFWPLVAAEFIGVTIPFGLALRVVMHKGR